MRRIMIIDSDLNQIEVLKEALQGRFLVLSCNKGAKAMDLLRIFQPSALILDPSTHGLGGEHFLRSVQALPYLGKIPILVLARPAAPGRTPDNFGLDADQVLSKPCQPDKVLRKLDRLLPAQELPRPIP